MEPLDRGECRIHTAEEVLTGMYADGTSVGKSARKAVGRSAPQARHSGGGRHEGRDGEEIRGRQRLARLALWRESYSVGALKERRNNKSASKVRYDTELKEDHDGGLRHWFHPTRGQDPAMGFKYRLK
jgi:hypothetical protein